MGKIIKEQVLDPETVAFAAMSEAEAKEFLKIKRETEKILIDNLNSCKPSEIITKRAELFEYKNANAKFWMNKRRSKFFKAVGVRQHM